jgi:hypothetical protein
MFVWPRISVLQLQSKLCLVSADFSQFFFLNILTMLRNRAILTRFGFRLRFLMFLLTVPAPVPYITCLSLRFLMKLYRNRLNFTWICLFCSPTLNPFGN